MNKYQAQKARYFGKPVPPGLKHGQSGHASSVYGCPCSVCHQPREGKKTWTDHNREDRALTPAERNRKLRAAKKGTPVPPGTKHGVYTYKTYGCPCAICAEANRRQKERKRNRWRETARGRWTTRGTMDSICWPPKDADPDWVCPGCTDKEVA